MEGNGPGRESHPRPAYPNEEELGCSISLNQNMAAHVGQMVGVGVSEVKERQHTVTQAGPVLHRCRDALNWAEHNGTAGSSSSCVLEFFKPTRGISPPTVLDCALTVAPRVKTEKFHQIRVRSV